jgi:hypothetical protein
MLRPFPIYLAAVIRCFNHFPSPGALICSWRFNYNTFHTTCSSARQYANNIYITKKNRLCSHCSLPEQRIHDSFATLPEKAGDDISPEERRRSLNDALQPVVREIALEWPGYGFGYYDKTLGIVVLSTEEPRPLGTMATGETLKTFAARRTEAAITAKVLSATAMISQHQLSVYHSTALSATSGPT